MIEWLVIAVLALGVAGGTARVAELHHDARRYLSTLAHIDALERELGIGVPLDDKIDQAVAEWRQEADPPLPVPAKRIYGSCLYCKLRVVLNDGRCQVPHGARCAKEEWRMRDR